MSDLGVPGRALRPYGGEARRREAHASRGLPRDGAVVVHELRYLDGSWHLEVEASWRGVPVGAPPALPGTRPGIAHDQVDVGHDVELARAVARVAEDDLRGLRTPDLVAALARLRNR